MKRLLEDLPRPLVRKMTTEPWLADCPKCGAFGLRSSWRATFDAAHQHALDHMNRRLG